MTDVFVGLAESEARAMGFPQLPMIVIPHPLGVRSDETVEEYALQTLLQLISLPEKSALGGEEPAGTANES